MALMFGLENEHKDAIILPRSEICVSLGVNYKLGGKLCSCGSKLSFPFIDGVCGKAIMFEVLLFSCL